MLRLRRDGERRDSGRRESSSPSKLAPQHWSGLEADVLVQQQQAELEEMRLQQASAVLAHEAALEEARGQAMAQSSRAGLAERKATQLERQVEGLTEQVI